MVQRLCLLFGFIFLLIVVLLSDRKCYLELGADKIAAAIADAIGK